MQRPDVVRQVNLDVVGIHHAVAVDVDLEGGVAAGLIDPGFGVRRARRSVECCRAHEVDRAGEAVRTRSCR